MKWLLILVVLMNAAFFTWTKMAPNKNEAPQEQVYAPPVSEKIRLLSEPENAEQKTAIQEAQTQSKQMAATLNQALKVAQSNSQKGDSKANFCPRLEVERKANEAKVTQQLTQLGWRYRDKEVVGKRPKYWLYIEAPATKEKARAIVKELKAQSIDSFIITRGEMKNRISLGLLSSQERASEAKQRIEKESGYTVSIYDHMRTVTLHRIDIEQPLSNADWQMFISKVDLTKIMMKIEKNPC